MKINKIINKLRYLSLYRFRKQKLIISKIAFSGDGILIDVRYWVSRPDKINPKINPFIITTRNERLELMHIAKFGAIKSQTKKYTNTGILLFYNKNKAVSKGDRVTLYWDGLKAENIIIY